MSKFTEDAKLLLEYIGGKDNIKAVTHCVTRMRFVLIDEKKADVKKIESLQSDICTKIDGKFSRNIYTTYSSTYLRWSYFRF